MKRKRLSLLTLPEMDQILALANFTDLQTKIFKMLCRDHSDIYVMTSLYLSNTKYYEEKEIIYEKARRILGIGTPIAF